MELMMKTKLCCLMAMSVLAFMPVGCKEAVADRTEAPRQAMREALDALAAGDDSAYVARLDFGAPLDSAQISLFAHAVTQQRQREAVLRGGLLRVEVISARMLSDTVATVFYRRFFSNGDSTECAQKMVRTDGVWKIRVRN